MLQAQFYHYNFLNRFSKVFGLQLEKLKQNCPVKNVFFVTYSSEILHISIELRNTLDISLTEVSVEARNIEIQFQ
jgi:hypothetical protein